MKLIQNTKIQIVFMLICILCAFLVRGVAYAYDDTEDDLSIDNIRLVGDTLHFTVTDKLNGLIHEMELNLLDLSDLSGEFITIDVENFDGSLTSSLTIRNPYYSLPSGLPKTDVGDAPVNSNPFTPDGTGTVLDNATDGDGKEFFTVETPDGNVFYLIIDRQRTSENVYLLNAVTEDDLMSLAVSEDGKQTVDPEPSAQPIEQQSDNPTAETPASSNTSNSSDNSTIIFVVIAVVVAGGIGYYIKIVRPKRNADMDDDDEDEDEEPENHDNDFHG